ncbi:hypothetical protein KQI61_15510 [Anaerocolumna aminovalerica]|uniref:hypothetical protein n=1 Tax=Anaerocolumna aminovalerica TaxID=1527 RepID=UPI001C0EE3E4|nr:hypothetical protein [Anaerocolumna aminovalerica]MBU5333606.1 hypothetical protein [Anaerocolumna aminovalerica]
MKKSLIDKSEKLKSMYLTESDFNVDPDLVQDNKYFLKFYNTNKLVFAAKTQKEMEEHIDEILEHGVQQESYTFF